MKGKYALSLVGYNLLPISCNIDDKQFIISGCNTISIAYTAQINGNFKVNSAAALTKKACLANNDNAIIAAIKSADRF